MRLGSNSEKNNATKLNLCVNSALFCNDLQSFVIEHTTFLNRQILALLW